MKISEIEICLRGDKLYGDDFSPEEVVLWVKEEREGYAELGAKDRSHYQYKYHALNHAHAFRYVREESFSHVLSIGGAYGDELLPILPSVSRVTILEPSDAFVSKELEGVPVSYVKPNSSNDLPFADQTFDLVTCFGCLHHIPNVSKVVGEIFRCLVPGGLAFVREPTISMGDWRHQRRGLTRLERGIPLQIFRKILHDAGFIIRNENLCVFPIIPRLTFMFGKDAYNSRKAVELDRVLSRLFSWNSTYHPSSFIGKLQPMAAAFVLARPS
ncbi:MAG: class I SAM-dependent methyltransferase [Nitrospirales bacterium]|nr:class I SAM-dependent methyltransferase [Nitrospirales bacterium]